MHSEWLAGILVSGLGEWRRQRIFLELLGRRLELPVDLWQRRVIPALLPQAGTICGE